MPEQTFQICGASVPRLIGRSAIMKRLLAGVGKPLPSHMQIVGPKFVGKSVILHALAQELRAPGSSYSAVCLWDLGHLTPGTDEEFMHALCAQFVVALSLSHHFQLADYLREIRENPYQEMLEVLSELQKGGARIALLCDGFDRPLSNPRLTRNLWDQLREMASRPSLCIVTASRQRLQYLLSNPDAQTSDFWNIFDAPIHVRAFDENDVTAAIESCGAIGFATGARTELTNQTGGLPPLLLAVLNAVLARTVDGTVTAEIVRAAADAAFESVSDFLAASWNDCSEASRCIYNAVRETGQLPLLPETRSDLDPLLDRGFCRIQGSRIRGQCRLLDRFTSQNGRCVSSLALLIGTSTGFRSNVCALLREQLAQARVVDATLHSLIDAGIGYLPGKPESCLVQVREILDRALALIWDRELGQQRRIDRTWVDRWAARRDNVSAFEEGKFPSGNRSLQIRLLQLMTLTTDGEATARWVTHATYSLANGLHSYANLGQHQGGVDIDLSIAYVATTTAIGLAARITSEMSEAAGDLKKPLVALPKT